MSDDEILFFKYVGKVLRNWESRYEWFVWDNHPSTLEQGMQSGDRAKAEELTRKYYYKALALARKLRGRSDSFTRLVSLFLTKHRLRKRYWKVYDICYFRILNNARDWRLMQMQWKMIDRTHKLLKQEFDRCRKKSKHF